MRKERFPPPRFAAAILAVMAAHASLAQSGDLAGVTMRVLDDISGLDAVVIELDAPRGTDAENAEGPSPDEAAEEPTVEAEDEESAEQPPN